MHRPDAPLQEQRKDYAEYRRKTRDEEGFDGNFKAACIKSHGSSPTTPAQWVEAASIVYWSAYADNHAPASYSDEEYNTEPYEVANGPRDFSEVETLDHPSDW